MTVESNSKARLFNRAYSLDEIAARHGLARMTLYRRVKRQLKSSVFIVLDGQTYIITQTTVKIFLVPISALPVDSVAAEKSGALYILDALIPCLCDQCKKSTQRLKDDIAKT